MYVCFGYLVSVICSLGFLVLTLVCILADYPFPYDSVPSISDYLDSDLCLAHYAFCLDTIKVFSLHCASSSLPSHSPHRTLQLFLEDGKLLIAALAHGMKAHLAVFPSRCTKDGQTVMGINGGAQFSRFSFEAFRFVQHKNVTISTFYLHCATRLCDRSVCVSLQPVNKMAARSQPPQTTETIHLRTKCFGGLLVWLG